MRAVSLDDRTAIFETDSLLEYEAAGFGKESVFNSFDSFVEGVLGIAQVNGNRFLKEDRSVVNLVVDEMDRRAGDLHSVLERVSNAMGAGEGRQQRRMEIDQSTRERIHENRCKYSHEAGRHYEVGTGCTDFVRKGSAPLGARSVGGWLHDGGLDPPLVSRFHPSARPVGGDESHGARHPARVARVD